MQSNHQTIDISLSQIIAALNDYLAHQRDPYESSCELDVAGGCFALTIASIIRKDLEDELRYFLQASLEERYQRNTRAERFGRWLADFIPFFYEPKGPYLGKNGVRLSQLDTLVFAGLKVLGKYTICLTEKKLADSFALLQDVPCTILFCYNNHIVHVKYENRKFYVYDPCQPKGTLIFDKYLAAAKFISKIFILANKDSLPEKLKTNFKYNVHIEIVKEESDSSTLKPTQFMKRLALINRPTNDESTTDVIEMQGLRLALWLRDNRNMPAILTKNFLKIIGDISNLESFIQTTSLHVLKDLLLDKEFIKNVKNLTENRNRDIEDMLLKYNIYPEVKLIAASLLMIIKRDGRTLEDIVLKDYEMFGDPALVALINIDFLKKVAAASHDLEIKKIAIKQEMASITPELLQEVKHSEDVSKSQTVLSYFYSVNNIMDAISYIFEHKDNYVFMQKILPTIDTLINLSIYDDKVEWFDFCLRFFPSHPMQKIINCLSMAMKYESKDIFKRLADKLDVNQIASIYPLLSVSEDGTAAFLDFMIEYFKSRNILSYLALQSTDLGENPLHCAVYKGKKKVVQSLLKLNIDLNINTISLRNETPLYIACEQGHVEIAEMLFIRSPKNDCTMPNGMNLFEAAENSTNPNMLNCIRNLFLTRSINDLCVMPVHIVIHYFLEYVFEMQSSLLCPLMDKLLTQYALDELLQYPAFNHHFTMRQLSFVSSINDNLAPEPIFENVPLAYELEQQESGLKRQYEEVKDTENQQFKKPRFFSSLENTIPLPPVYNNSSPSF